MEEMPTLTNVTFHSASTYKILDELGRGGMGMVYLAERNSEGVIDHVVLKTLKTIDIKQIEQLRNEANIATILRHENIVKSYGMESIPISKLPPRFRDFLDALKPKENNFFHTKHVYRPKLTPKKSLTDSLSKFEQTNTIRNLRDDEKLYCMAMNYVEGVDLGNLYRKHLRMNMLIPCILTGFIVSRICRALSYAHKYIVHRDISPENIMIDRHGVAKLMDFGIAVVAGVQKEFAGKVVYMSPEQLSGDKLDGRSDIYSLGLVAYQMLTGINLFVQPEDMSFNEHIVWIARKMAKGFPLPHELRKDVPLALSEIIGKMLRTKVEHRYQDAEEVCTDLEQNYLYAKGFGPTNNSMASYVEIFEKNFSNVSLNQLNQLNFMKDKTGVFTIKRRFSLEDYSILGKKLFAETQQKQLSYLVIKKQADDKQK
ncbi:MAG: serine/threonine protein kinase [Planctomycetes bacterium]|nr:serine/threonine protein kinase [Planctomycetota bacterium]